MRLKDFMDMEKLQQIQDQFSDATGLAAIAVDAEGNYITKPSNFTDFCIKYTRGSAEGLRRCVKCDNECTGTYFCHAGLMDFSCPIVVEGTQVGAMLGGQVLPGEPDEQQFRSIAAELGVDPDAYISALKKVPVRPEKNIRASAALLNRVVNELVNLEYLKSASRRKMETFDAQSALVAEAVQSVRKQMRDLSQIASMENILAVNAAIEAGRAGHAGVGFAVVAKEMGQLSRQASSVYQEIYARIDEINRSIDAIRSAGL